MAEPPITLLAHMHGGTGNLPIKRIVVHATAPDVGFPKASAKGSAHGSAQSMHVEKKKFRSSHYIVGVDGEEHCLPEDTIAFHAPPNAHSIGVEITADGGFPESYVKHPQHAYTKDQWLDDQVFPAVIRAAARVRELCLRHGVPMVQLTVKDLKNGEHGICGHVDVSNAFHESNHTDPGPNFPWEKFMAMVTSSDDPLLMLEDDMPVPKDLWAYDQDGKRRQAWSYLQTADANARAAARDAAAALEIVKEMAKMGRALTTAEVEAAAKAGAAAALKEQNDDEAAAVPVPPG